MYYKENWDETKERYIKWWNKKLDGALIQVYSPKEGISKRTIVWDGWNLVRNIDNPEKGLEEFEVWCREIFFGRDAFPNLFVNYGTGVMAAFLGAVTPKVTNDTVWFEEPRPWDEVFKCLNFNSDSFWWNLVKDTTKIALKRGKDKFIVAMTDYVGALNILADLRGTQNLLLDLNDEPEKVIFASKKLTELWFKYYTELSEIISKEQDGFSSWIPIWCPKRWYPVQCDFSYMISPKMFEKFVLPLIEEECRFLDYSIYHLDGPGEIPHLEMLLDIPELTGIQWVPGAGNPDCSSSKWYSLYKRIQARNKLLVLDIPNPMDLDSLFQEISPSGVFITTYSRTESEAKELLKKAKKWTTLNFPRV